MCLHYFLFILITKLAFIPGYLVYFIHSRVYTNFSVRFEIYRCVDRMGATSSETENMMPLLRSSRPSRMALPFQNPRTP